MPIFNPDQPVDKFGNFSKHPSESSLKQAQTLNTNDLLSREEISYIDLLCEGPIAGPVDKKGQLVYQSPEREAHRLNVQGKILYESVYLNDVPVKNFNANTYNFRHVDVNMRLGQVRSVNPSNGMYEDGSMPYQNYPFNEQRNTTQLNSKLIGWWDGSNTKSTVIKNSIDAENNGATPASFMILNPDVEHVILNFNVVLSDFSQQDPAAAKVNLGLIVQCEDPVQNNEVAYNPANSPDNISSFTDEGSAEGHVSIETVNGENTIRIAGLAPNPAVISVRVRLPKDRNPNRKNRIIRVYKLNAERDADGRTKLNQSVTLTSVVECIPCSLRYPYSATAAISIDSRGVGSNPSRSYDLKLLKVAVPSNYRPWNENTKRGEKLYSGNWDGTFKSAWTSNPAWCFYDLLINRKHALGKFGLLADHVDKWSLYEIAKYCDNVDENGNWLGVPKYGSSTEYEPRYTCNVLIDQRQEAFDLLYNMASIFNGMLYWGFGSLFASIDKKKDPVMHFSEADISEDGFNYSSSPKTTRVTVSKVRYNDADDDFRSKIEYVEDADAIRQFGIVEKDVVAFGCTSRGQAHRLAKWILITSQYETETVQFKAGMKASYLRPGDVFSVFDGTAEDKRFAGKITDINTSENSIKIDYPIVHLTNGSKDFPLRIKLLSPSRASELSRKSLSHSKIERVLFSKSYLVTSISDDGLRLTLGNDDPEISTPSELYRVPIGSSWIIDHEEKNPETRIKKYSTIAVNQEEQNEFSVVAVEYQEEKYDNVSQSPKNRKKNPYSLSGLDLAEENFIADPELSPITITSHVGKFQESIWGLPLKAFVFWQAVPGANQYVIHWKLNNQSSWSSKQGPIEGLRIFGARGESGEDGDYSQVPMVKMWSWSKTIDGAETIYEEGAFLTEYDGYYFDSVMLPKDPAVVTVEAYTVKNGVWSSNRYVDKAYNDNPLDYNDIKDKKTEINNNLVATQSLWDQIQSIQNYLDNS